MNLARQLLTDPSAAALRDAFLAWQCRVRQQMMRDDLGRPGPGIMPSVTLDGADAPMGHIITLITKRPERGAVPEMQHIVRRTNDPARRREDGLKLLSETYYQKPREFSDLITATFPPGSPGATAIREAGRVRLTFEAFRQRFDIVAQVWRLAGHHAAHQATWWHNAMFNPTLPPDTVVLGFEPDWMASTASPDPRGPDSGVAGAGGPDRY